MKARLAIALTLLAATSARAADRHRYAGEAERFDFGIESEGETATLYLAKKPTNAPLTGVEPTLVPDDEKTAPIVFTATAEPGVYAAPAKDGRIPEGQLSVSVDGEEEAVDVYLVEDGGHGGHEAHAGHDHAHGPKEAEPIVIKGRTIPLVGASLGGLFILGFLIGRATRKKPHVGDGVRTTHEHGAKEPRVRDHGPRAGIFLAALLGGALSSGDAGANEGHTHDTVEANASITAEVTVSKRSQFLIGLRTEPAKLSEATETLVTMGHVTPSPQGDASIRSPIAGFLRLGTGVKWGASVKKGQQIARAEGLSSLPLHAPIGGVLQEVAAIDGVRVDANELVFRIVDTSVVWIDSEVFQKDLNSLSDSPTARVDLDGGATGLTGRVIGAKSAIDEKTLAAKVFVELDNRDGKLPLGALAHVTFTKKVDSQRGFVLPKGAVLNRGGERLVYVQTGAESFAPRSVATRFGPDPGTVVVTKGLREGDRVVITGNYQLLVGAN